MSQSLLGKRTSHPPTSTHDTPPPPAKAPLTSEPPLPSSSSVPTTHEEVSLRIDLWDILDLDSFIEYPLAKDEASASPAQPADDTAAQEAKIKTGVDSMISLVQRWQALPADNIDTPPCLVYPLSQRYTNIDRYDPQALNKTDRQVLEVLQGACNHVDLNVALCTLKITTYGSPDIPVPRFMCQKKYGKGANRMGEGSDDEHDPKDLSFDAIHGQKLKIWGVIHVKGPSVLLSQRGTLKVAIPPHEACVHLEDVNEDEEDGSLLMNGELSRYWIKSSVIIWPQSREVQFVASKEKK
eukprot:TRINITY_DN7521_c0_g1_i3.p1 TRINITY_DN7521_c0_g1~~TRINITY_DN7521_c0_g1_i3.p1  ORF type:complete len:296 (-),score=49.15 TRINITY_DN7521_c0_g1_i3:20-907(-)